VRANKSETGSIILTDHHFYYMLFLSADSEKNKVFSESGAIYLCVIPYRSMSTSLYGMLLLIINYKKLGLVALKFVYRTFLTTSKC
jgi:hypothetical protein